MSTDDEILWGIPGDDKPYPHTRRVAELLRLPGTERSREQCRVIRRKQTTPRTARRMAKGALGVCDETFPRRSGSAEKKRRRGEGGPSAASGCSRRTAPRAGSHFVGCRRSSKPTRHHSTALSFPFHLSTHPAWPTVILPSPLSTMPSAKGTGKIDPFPPEETGAICSYLAQMHAVANLRESDRLTLDDCLARVDADLHGIGLDAASTGAEDRTKRRCYHRDHIWLRWAEDEGMTPAPIRDRWNREHPTDKIGPKDSGREVVKKGLDKARAERQSD